MSDTARDIDKIAHEICAWADRTFPDRTDQGMFLKLYGEIAEMIEAGDDCGDEIADVLILILDYAARKNIDPGRAIRNKMLVNMTRKWQRTASGNWQHVD